MKREEDGKIRRIEREEDVERWMIEKEEDRGMREREIVRSRERKMD